MKSLTPGTTLAGRFVIELVLGRGGMGQVVRARDKKLGRTVAIKFLPPATDGANDEGSQARLVREARAAAGLSHPNIIQVYDVGETDEGAVYVVMELVAGRSLRAHLADDDLGVGDLVRIAVESARALGSAHLRGVVHRDVKPDNVMVRDDGRALVLDFGIAKRVHLEMRPDLSAGDTGLTQPGTVVGTPSYLSPEQITGGAVDGSADQFALAVTLYECLTGRLPWKNTRPMPLMGEIMMVQPPSPDALRADLPDGLAGVVMRALAKKPADRFADMDAFADALAPFAAAGERLSAQAGAQGPSDRPARPAITPRVATPEAIENAATVRARRPAAPSPSPRPPSSPSAAPGSPGACAAPPPPRCRRSSATAAPSRAWSSRPRGRPPRRAGSAPPRRTSRAPPSASASATRAASATPPRCWRCPASPAPAPTTTPTRGPTPAPAASPPRAPTRGASTAAWAPPASASR
jgi:serine/threonine-protein kinase